MKFKFGDVVINKIASKNNPIRRGIFVRWTEANIIMLTDMKGSFWKIAVDMKNPEEDIEIVGNVITTGEQDDG